MHVLYCLCSILTLLICHTSLKCFSCPNIGTCTCLGFIFSQHQLQPILNHPLHKTILCRSYHNDGICNYGVKCKFIHELSKKKRVPSPAKASQQPVILVLPLNMTLKQFTQIQKSENMEQTKQLFSQKKVAISDNLPNESQHPFLESIECQAQIPTMSSDHLLNKYN